MKQNITSLQHPLVKHLVKLRNNRDYRHEHHSLIVVGKKIIQELSAITPIKTILVSHPENVPAGGKIHEVIMTTDDVIQKISGLQSSDGIVAEIEMPKFCDLKGKDKVVVLDRINDPGNLGTIVRTALAFGFDGVFLLDDSCDPYNDKALRASRGSVFKIALAKGSIKDLKALIQNNGFKPYLADITGKNCEEIDASSKCLLILGNEANGPSDSVKELACSVTIPMQDSMESLNVSVAAGILMYTLSR